MESFGKRLSPLMRFSACKFPKGAVGDENEGEMNKKNNNVGKDRHILRKFKDDDDAMMVCFCWKNEEMDWIYSVLKVELSMIGLNSFQQFLSCFIFWNTLQYFQTNSWV